MRYELTSNTVLFAGITLYQIRALEDMGNIKAGTLGGYISKSSNVQFGKKGWIENNSYIIDSVIIGDIHIESDVIIWDSYIHGKMWIGKKTRIRNSNINTWRDYGTIVNGTKIIDKDLKFSFALDNRITDSGYFRQFMAGKALVLCGNEYVKCGCKTFTYKYAYNLLRIGKIAIGIEANGSENEMNLWLNNREQLMHECEKELERLKKQKQEEDE